MMLLLLLLLLLLLSAAAAAVLSCLHLAFPALGWWQKDASTTANPISISTMLLTAGPA
jgi:hypothetical protein